MDKNSALTIWFCQHRYNGFAIKIVVPVTILKKYGILTIHLEIPINFLKRLLIVLCSVIPFSWGFPELQENPRISENLESPILNYSHSSSNK